MTDLASQIADMERELLALTGNQPPNPAQIKTFKIEHTSATANEIKTITFDDIPRFIQVYGTSDQATYIYVDGGQLKTKIIFDDDLATYISLGDFNVV